MSDHTLPDLGVIDLGSEFTLDLDTFLKHPYEEIGEAAVELPAIIEWVNQQLQWVIEQKGVKKQELKTVRARAFVKLKNGEAQDKIAGKVSEKALEQLIELDDHVISVNEELSKVLGWSSRLSNLLYVLQAKLDLVRSTESTRRKLITGNEDE
jgi:hypothetical protein